MSRNRPSVILRIRPLTRVWTTKGFAPEGWTRNPKLLSVPSQRVYSRAFGLAAAMAATFSRVFPVLFGMICFPLPATGQRAADDPGHAPRWLAEMAVGKTGVTLGGAGVGVPQQPAHGVEVEAAHHRMDAYECRQSWMRMARSPGLFPRMPSRSGGTGMAVSGRQRGSRVRRDCA